MAGISPSRERMIEDMTVRNFAQATRQSYLYAVAKCKQAWNFGSGANLVLLPMNPE